MSEDTISGTETTYCARHPRVETGLTCAHCGTPICPQCMVVTPVGMKCRDCGRVKDSPLFKVTPGRLVLAALVALVAGAIASLVGKLGFFVIFASIPYGYFAGSMILAASGMKRGVKLEILTGIFMVLGAIAAVSGPSVVAAQLMNAPAGALIRIALSSLAHPFVWVAIIISTCCAVSKIR